MGKIKGWRADDQTCKSDIDKFIEQRTTSVRERSLADYGRSDIPECVQREAESYALRKRVSTKNALEMLITEAGSLEALAARLKEEHKKSAKIALKNFKKAARATAEAARKPISAPSQLQSAIDASKRTRYVSIVPGGAPGLGKRS